MSNYYQQFHPLTKCAGKYGIPNALTQFLSLNLQSLKNKLSKLRQPSFYKQLASDNRGILIGGAAGLPIGAYMGNQAFNNSLPPVRALPDIQQSPLLEVEKPYGNK